jgi:hypothetical protein
MVYRLGPWSTPPPAPPHYGEGLGEGFFLRLPQRQVQIPEVVVDVLDPDREADEIRRYPGRNLFRGRELGLGRAGGMDREALRIAHIRQMATRRPPGLGVDSGQTENRKEAR